MEKQYSVDFFNSLIIQIQEVCQNYLSYNQFVEVSGYVSVEIDNMKKERYVLSELLQSSGHVLSESYCTKSFKTTPTVNLGQQFKETRQHGNVAPVVQSCNPNIGKRKSSSSLETRSTKASRHNQFVQESDNENFSTSSIPGQGTHCQISPSTNVKSPHSSVSKNTNSPSLCVANREKEVNYQQVPSSTKIEQDSLQEEVIDIDLLDDDDPGSIEEEGQGEMEVLPSTSHGRKTQLSPGSATAVLNAVKRLNRFVTSRHGTEVDLLTSTPDYLNEMLLQYFKEARKKDGSELAPVSMKNLMAFLERFLTANNYAYSVTKADQFKPARDYIKVKMEESVKASSHILSPLNSSDIEVLFQFNVLGSQQPEALANTMWFLNSMYFNIRRPSEHFKLKWGQIVLKVDENGEEYLERALSDNFSLKVFPNYANPDRCYVNYYKQFKAQRPKLQMDELSPFYLKPNKFPGETDTWLSDEPLTFSMLSTFWRKMLIASGLPLNKRIVGESVNMQIHQS